MPTPTTNATESLRRLTMPHALRFSSELLLRGSGGIITFREFLAVAREFVARSHDDAAMFLAALVALDMANEDDVVEVPMPRKPSVN